MGQHILNFALWNLYFDPQSNSRATKDVWFLYPLKIRLALCWVPFSSAQINDVVNTCIYIYMCVYIVSPENKKIFHWRLWKICRAICLDWSIALSHLDVLFQPVKVLLANFCYEKQVFKNPGYIFSTGETSQITDSSKWIYSKMWPWQITSYLL